MIRTVISLDEADKEWLDRRARDERVPMTEVVREAVRHYRVECESISLPDLLACSAGLWRGEDGLEHERRLRDEWPSGR